MAAARPDTWMPLYWGDYAKDTGHLSATHHGAYLMLIKHYWVTGKPLPNDDSVLWRIACADSQAHWKKMASVVTAFFSVEGVTLRHSRIDAELDKAFRFIDKQKENGGKGGRPKKPAETQSQTQTKPTGKPKPNPTAKPKITTSQSPSPSSVHDEITGGDSLAEEPVDPAGEPASEERPGHANLPSFLRRQPHGTASLIGPDFEPELETREAALTARSDLTESDIDRRHGEFRTWCAEKAITSHNFDATWYAFMMRTHEKRTRNGHHQSVPEEDPVSAGIRESLARRHILAGG